MRASAGGRWIFDAAVLVAVASAGWMVLAGNWDGSFRFAVVAGFMLAARGADVPAPFSAAFATFLLLATWVAVANWYKQVTQFDLLVHFLTPGSMAAVFYFVLVQARLLPAVPRPLPALRSWAPVVWVTVVGVTAAVVWEFYEWAVEQIVPSGMTLVGYTDTVVDLFAGMLGSLAAGALVLVWGRRQGLSRRPVSAGEAA